MGGDVSACFYAHLIAEGIQFFHFFDCFFLFHFHCRIYFFWGGERH